MLTVAIEYQFFRVLIPTVLDFLEFSNHCLDIVRQVILTGQHHDKIVMSLSMSDFDHLDIGVTIHVLQPDSKFVLQGPPAK